MKNAITPMGVKWELLKSLWILWLVVPFGFTSYISFFYISMRVKKRSWFIAGLIYSFIFIQFVLVDEFNLTDGFIGGISTMLLFVGWIAAWVHALNARKQYLPMLLEKIQLDARSIPQPQDAFEMSPPVVSATAVAPLDTELTNENLTDHQRQPETFEKKVNMNIATIEEIASVPSIGNILASQIVEVRKQEGPFHDFADFVELVAIKPHILAKAKPFMTFAIDDFDKGNDKQQHSQSKHSAGRVVDY
ncbi:ComEA family DNA-binding protein [Amphibacillus jilinensis]|uniref:ComEA family DNA-binding protein n=1 Tax=Amphibacillus jilinensis TaxID=1216008 RepID=UPI0003081077|nr:helix-hairpin-helix domain-containing protein [Amphibacillus jilinensis]